MNPATLGLAFLAGLLSILSPCVLPLVPIVFGTAAGEHRFGPVALAAGVTMSFVATIGFSFGIDGDAIRTAGAAMLILAGLVLAAPPLQARVALAGGAFGGWADGPMRALSSRGLSGQFGVGMLLGAVCSPCAGPTLGAASVLAAQSGGAGTAALTMASFGLGAALPLGLIGLVSRAAFVRWRGVALHGGKSLKIAMGLALIVIGAGIVSGLDRGVETWLAAASPEWLTRLTTRF